jgi:hypothetical protein
MISARVTQLPSIQKKKGIKEEKKKNALIEAGCGSAGIMLLVYATELCFR